ncbi:MAG: hypothetical protein J6U86_04195, partial [Clostridia bacterium]|nr:hypothetical protein [Clostridia bacterium]
RAEGIGRSGGDIIYYHDVDDVKINSESSFDITANEVETIRSIGKKSISQFNLEDMEKAHNWEQKFNRELGIKSPFFRARFGDWRAYETTKITPISFSVKISSRSDAEQYLKEGLKRKTLFRGNVKNNDSGFLINIGAHIYNDTLTYANSQYSRDGNKTKYINRISLLSKIEDIVKHSVLLDTETVKKESKNPNQLFVHRLFSVAQNQYEKYLVKLTVNELISVGDTVRRAYNIDNIEISPVAVSRDLGPADTTDDINGEYLSINSISDLFAIVKRYDRSFSPKPVDHKLLNADGTPNAFYVGTESVSAENKFFNNGDALMLETDMSEQKKDVRYQDRDLYTEKEYNDFGWARANDFLSAGENANYRAKFAMLKTGQARFPKTKNGEYMIAVSDIISAYKKSSTNQLLNIDSTESPQLTPEASFDSSATKSIVTQEKPFVNRQSKKHSALDSKSNGVENVIVYAKGTIEHPIITKVLRIDLFEESEKLDKKRREIYDTGRRGLQPKIGELCRFYYGAGSLSFGEYKRDKLSHDRNNLGFNTDRETGSGKAARAKGIGRTPEGHIIYYHEEPSKMSQDTNENQTMYQYRIEEPSPGEILQDLFAENSSYNGYKEYAVSLNKYRDMLERVGDLNKEIQDIDAKIGELRSQHRQSGKGTRMDDLYQKRIRCEGKIEKLKNRMLKMEAKQLRKVIEAEERRAVASAEKRQRDKYFAQSKERREREIKRYYIDNIQKQVKAMSEQFKTNNARKRIPDELKAPISELLTAIDFSSRKSLIFGTQTEKEILLKNAVKRIQELSKLSNADGVPELDLPPRFAEEWDKVVAFVSTLAKGNSSDPPDIMILEQMEVSDLRALDRSIGDIQHAVSVANEIISKANAEPITELSEKMAKYLNERPMIEKDGALSNFLKWENTLPIYAFDRLGTVGSQLFEAFQDGFDKLVTEINEITEFTRSVYTEDEVKRWSKEVYSFDCETLDGEQRKIYLTVPQIMSFYCLSKREHAGPHFQGGGIVSENIKAGKERYINDARGVRLSDETIEQIISRLSPRQKEVADKLQSFLSNDCADWGNEISMKRYGIRMFLEYNYFPIATKESGRTIGEKATHQGAKMYEILNMSFTKPISEQANCQIIISDIFDVFAEHAGSMARYHSLALPVLDFLRVYNYSSRRYGADNTHERTNIRDSMKNAYGLGAIRYFNDFLTTISGGNWAHDASTLQSKLTKGAKVAMVGFNIRSAIQQPTAAVRALMYLGVSDMSLSLSPIGIKKARDLAMKYCPMAVWKSMGHFDIGTGRGMAEIIRNTRTVRDKSIEASMYLAEKADEYTWAYLWKACEHYISRTTSLSEGSEEYYKAVGKKLREVIYKTQVVDSPLTRSQFMSSTSELKKMTAMFASEGTVTYNMLLDAVSNDNRTKNQKRRAVAAICGIYAVQAILLAAVQSAVDGMRDDDEDEEYGDKYLEAFISNLISELNPLNKLPYIRDLISALEGYATSRTDTTLFSKLGNAVRALWRVFSDENITVYKTVYRLLDAASTATGIAVSNALRDIIALWNTVIGELYPELKIK